MPIRAIVFDLGNTLIEQIIDSEKPLNQLTLKLLPGVKPTLQVLSQRYQIALLTNTTQSTSKAVSSALRKLSIVGYFDFVLTSIDVGLKKPDPRLFHLIIRQLGVAPKNTIMVGNDRAEDIRPAAKLGMLTAYFTEKHDPNYLEPDFQFSSFVDLPHLIDELEARHDGIS